MEMSRSIRRIKVCPVSSQGFVLSYCFISVSSIHALLNTHSALPSIDIKPYQTLLMTQTSLRKIS